MNAPRSRPPQLKPVVRALLRVYGDIAPKVTDPFEMILLENAAYLVPDDKRLEIFKALREEFGATPEAILEHEADQIASVIESGGMRPLMRANKLIDASKIAQSIGLDSLARAIKTDATRAKKLLRRFPGVGEPYADRILLFAGVSLTLAPDSNALRVLVRLGFATEEKNYSKMYQAATDATTGQLTDASFARSAHMLLRRHGQEVCKRTAPLCDVCAVRSECAWYRNRRSIAS
jgi:endonuclease III